MCWTDALTVICKSLAGVRNEDEKREPSGERGTSKYTANSCEGEISNQSLSSPNAPINASVQAEILVQERIKMLKTSSAS